MKQRPDASRIGAVLRDCTYSPDFFEDYHLNELMSGTTFDEYRGLPANRRLEALRDVVAYVLGGAQAPGGRCRVDLILMIQAQTEPPLEHPIQSMDALAEAWSIHTTREPPLFIFRSSSTVAPADRPPVCKVIPGFKQEMGKYEASYQVVNPHDEEEEGEYRYYLTDRT